MDVVTEQSNALPRPKPAAIDRLPSLPWARAKKTAPLAARIYPPLPSNLLPGKYCSVWFP